MIDRPQTQASAVDQIVVAYTGIRDVADAWSDHAELAVLDAAVGAIELRFGGALGIDTLALATCAELDVRRVVYVPFRIGGQPRSAQAAIRRHATHVVELDLPPGNRSFLRRNDRMIEGTHRVHALTDGRSTGGTAYTIHAAVRARVPVFVTAVGSRRQNPQIEGLSGDVFAMLPYVTARHGDYDWASETVRRIKAGTAEPASVEALAVTVARYIEKIPRLARATAIVTMPRQLPGQPSDLHRLALMIGHEVRKPVITDALVRVEIPTDGVARLFRVRFLPDEHARTIDATALVGYAGHTVIVIDNVLTTGATMEGALRAIRRDAGADPVGLGILYSAQGGLHVAA